MKFLIVDDDSVARMLIGKYVENYGKSDFAVDGENAFQMFLKAHEENIPYNVIFLDIMMPHVDGHETLQKIRKWEENKKLLPEKMVKVVMTTSLNDPKSILTSFKNGCEEFLVKPLSKTKIIQSLSAFDIISEPAD